MSGKTTGHAWTAWLLSIAEGPLVNETACTSHAEATAVLPAHVCICARLHVPVHVRYAMCGRHGMGWHTRMPKSTPHEILLRARCCLNDSCGIRIYTCTYAPASTHAHVRMHHTCIHANMHTCTHACTQNVYLCACMCIQVRWETGSCSHSSLGGHNYLARAITSQGTIPPYGP